MLLAKLTEKLKDIGAELHTSFYGDQYVMIPCGMGAIEAEYGGDDTNNYGHIVYISFRTYDRTHACSSEIELGSATTVNAAAEIIQAKYVSENEYWANLELVMGPGE